MVTARVPQGSLPTHAVPVGGARSTGGEWASKAWHQRKKGLRGRESMDLGKKAVVEKDPQF